MEKKYIADNGVRVYSYPNPALHSFFISLFVSAGNMYSPAEEAGYAHFLEHIMIRDLNYRSGGELYRTLDLYGMELNAETYNEMIHFYITGAREYFAVGAKIIASLLSDLSLPASEFEAERARIKAEMREDDERGSLAALSCAAVWEGTSLAAPIVGTRRGISRISLRRLSEYKRRAVCDGNLFFYLTGAVGEAEAELMCRECAAYTLPHGEPGNNLAPVPTSFFRRDARVDIKGADFTMLRFSFDIDMKENTVECTDLLYDVLLCGNNGRLYLEMSEKRGFFYDHSSSLERYSNIGTLSFSYEVRPGDIYDAVACTVDILRELKTSLPQLEYSSAGYIKNALWLSDDAREFNFTYAYDYHILSDSEADIGERISRYSAVTPQMVMEAAGRIFRPETLVLTVKGNKRRIDAEKLRAILKTL